MMLLADVDMVAGIGLGVSGLAYLFCFFYYGYFAESSSKFTTAYLILAVILGGGSVATLSTPDYEITGDLAYVDQRH